MACACSEGFINPPSLMRTVYRFDSVSDCTMLGGTLRVFHNSITALYGVGALLAFLLAVGASKTLHSLGVCRESGVYVVTPAPSTSRQPSPELSTVGTSIHNWTMSTAVGGHTAPYRLVFKSKNASKEI